MADQLDPHINPQTKVWDDNYYANRGKNLGSGGMTTPGSSDQVGGFLNDFHDAVLQAKKTISDTQSPEQIMQQVKGSILPAQKLPTAPDLQGEFKQLRLDQGVQPLEQSLSTLKDQARQIDTNFFQQQLDEQGKPVAMNVIDGRINEEQKQAMIKKNFIGTQISHVTDELTMRYNTINSIMQFTQQSYDNALKSYDTELQTNMHVYDAFTQAENTQTQNVQKAEDTILSIDDKVYQMQQDSIKTATANLQVYGNLIASGNVSFDKLSPDQKMNITKLEVQSGLGVGFLQNLRADNPNGKIMYAGPKGAVMQMPDGSLKTVSYSVGGGTGAETATQMKADEKSASGEMSQKLSGVANSYGNVSPKQWQSAMSAWESAGFDSKTFVNNFKQYTDPNRGDFDQAYGFSKKERSSLPQSDTNSTVNNYTN